MPRFGFIALVICVVACGSSSSSGGGSSATVASFDAHADLHSTDHFFDYPYPSDSRLTADGAPDLAGIANPLQSTVLEGLRTIAQQRKGFPQMPVAWFRFSAPLPPQDPTMVVAADASSSLLLVKLDGAPALVPVTASTPDSDQYVPENLLAITPRPGFILEPATRYAFVVKKSFGDAAGHPLGAPDAFAKLASASSGADAALYAPLWPALGALGIAAGDVAIATVFTTGGVVADAFALSEKVLAKYQITISNVAVLNANYDRYCELSAQVTYPQFQKGAPPYDTDGLFDIGADGLPAKQRDEVAPVTITLPKKTMPAGGFPLVVYFHGTGGRSTAVADRGTWHLETDASKCPDGELDTWNGQTGCNTAGTGPGYVVAEHGIAMAASALPVNPQRWPPGAKLDLPEYFNINNLASMRDIFRQGILEQRMFIAALRTLTIDPAVVSSCSGLALPQGETAFHFKVDPLLAQGQSMGAMYANLVSASEPRIKAVVASGAGGYWSYFILQTTFIANLPGKLGLLFGVHNTFTQMHPAAAVAQTGLEAIDPMVFMQRVAYSPLPNHPTRPVYQPVGKGDSYFPTTIQDAVALAYHNHEAGNVVWPTMQDALKLEKTDGMVAYPVSNDATNAAGAKFTGVTVQYEGDGIYDPHAIYSQLDAVKYQYGCFFDSLLRTGTATVPAPAALGTPCP
jgi:hypothetical protein